MHNIQVAKTPIRITNPNGATMESTHTAEMFLPGLPTAAKTGHIVPELASSPLLSIGQFCDAGCEVLFSAGDVIVKLHNEIILCGTRTPLSRLWIIDVPINPTTPQQQALNTSSAPTAEPGPTPAPTAEPIPTPAPTIEPTPPSDPSADPTPTKDPTGAPKPIFTPEHIYAFPPGHVALSALASATPEDIAAFMHGTYPPNHEALSAIGAATPADIVAFMHGAFFSPTLSALENAIIKQWIHNVPGLTLSRLRKFPPRSAATIKGHLKQTQKNLRSTKKKAKRTKPSSSNSSIQVPIQPDSDTEPETDSDSECELDDSDTNPVPDSPRNDRTHYCYASVVDIRSPEGQVYSDQTGRLPIPSSHGNNYLFVLYDYDSNHIFAEPMKGRYAKDILEAYKEVHARLVHCGLRPRLQRLDNECSGLLKEFMEDQQVDFQLAPPGMHRCNSAE